MLRNMTSIYITNKDKLLLLYRIGSKVVQPSWCGIGGHFEKDEVNNPKACVVREMLEETGITESDLKNIRLKYVTLRYKNNEIRQNYYFFADLANLELQLGYCSEGILEWIDISGLLDRGMPYTAKYVLKHYLEIGKNDNSIYAGIATDESTVFTELIDF
jgi:8-oxo-dGTP diphosphatase